jgi:putative membrane protein
MGTANIVPGVSGGTIALILGIYEELIDSIKDLANREAIKLLLRGKIARALDLLPWRFLLVVIVGILVASLSVAYLLEWVLMNYASMVWGFFFGLVLASIFTIGVRVNRWSLAPVLGVVLGALGVWALVGLVPAETPDTWWFLALSGALAASAMVLPGLSGAFILVLLGKYETVLSAVTNQEFWVLFWVAVGAAVGLVTFAQLLSWLFKRYHDITIAILTGMLVGSLRKLWPWKETIEWTVDRHGERVPLDQINVWPAPFTWEVALTVLLAIAGFALVMGLHVWSKRKERAVSGSRAEEPVG